MSIDQIPLSRQSEEPRPSTNQGLLRHEFPYNGGPSRSQEDAAAKPVTRDARNPSEAQRLGGRAVQGVSGGPQPSHRSLKHPDHPLNGLRPQMEHGRRSEDTARDPSPHPQAAIQVNERSRTMPATVTGGFNDPKSRALHGQQPAAQGVRGYQVGEHTGRRVERLIYHQPSRPPMHPHPQSDDSLAGGGQTLYPQSYHSRQASIGEVFDSYYHSPHHSHSPFAQGYANPVKTPLEEEMPNFDSQPSAGPGHTQGMTIDDHLDTHRVAPTLPSVPANALSFRSAEGFSRSKSSPNLQRQGTQEAQQYSDGFNFELPGSVPAMYSAGPQSRRNDYPSEVYGNPTSHSGNRNRQQPAPVDQTRVSAKEPNRAGTGGPSGSLPQSRSPDVRNPPPHSRPFSPNEQQSRKARNGPSPVNRIGLASPPVGQPSHPDSLPAHPVPVRAGLMASTPSNQPTRPPPVRQYSGGSGPLSGSPSSLNPHISRLPQEDSKLKAVTHQELEQLRHKTRNNSSDTRAQLLLAKKLVEAASVLADEGGRADSKTASRNRERFTSEAYKTVKKLAQSGDPDAMFYLGDCYSRGSLGLQTEPKEAFANYQAAAKAGHAQAAYRVAVCCEMGLDDGGGTKRDAVKAMQWYQRAATLGNTPAMYKLGVIRLKGLLGQPRDSKEALTWLQRAAEQADEENPHALHELVRNAFSIRFRVRDG